MLPLAALEPRMSIRYAEGVELRRLHALGVLIYWLDVSEAPR